MKKKGLIIVAVLLVILIIAGAGTWYYLSNDRTFPWENNGTNQTNNGEEGEPQELTVDFFGEFEPFECNGDYTSFSYISVVTNQDGTRFYAGSADEKDKHNNTLLYALPSGEERTLFTIGDTDADVEVMSFIDDALYFNISNSKEAGINGLYRMVLAYNEAGEVTGNDITLRFNLNVEPIRAKDNTLLLRLGEQYYTFDTQTGECAFYN